MISVESLRKAYGDVVAVAGSDFAVAAGEVFGLVGPNGAGKTTTLKMLAGLVDPTAGRVTVDDVPATDAEARGRVGWLPEESPLYDKMTAESYLGFFADLYDVPDAVAADRIEATLDRLDLDRRDRALEECSKGMRRKVAVARSVVHDPDVLIYDEPASGLDPVTTQTLTEFARELADDGKAVVFSAHDLHQVESVSDRVAIVRDGRIVARGSVPAIRAEHGGTEYRVYATVPVDGSVERGDRHEVTVDSMDEVETVRDRVSAAGGDVVDIRTRESSLEDVFLSVTGAES